MKLPTPPALPTRRFLKGPALVKQHVVPAKYVLALIPILSGAGLAVGAASMRRRLKLGAQNFKSDSRPYDREGDIFLESEGRPAGQDHWAGDDKPLPSEPLTNE